MLESFLALNPIVQALLAGVFTWGLAAAGALLSLVLRGEDRRALYAPLGFAAGVMIAALVWSLLEPALEIAGAEGGPAWVPVSIGFLIGAGFLRLLDLALPHLHPGPPTEGPEGPRTTWRRSVLLMLAMTLHNIPEGLALGVAFGAAASGVPSASVAGALMLTLGMGLQNLPEGIAVAVPLRADGMSGWRAVWYGQLSGIVEPVAAVAGAAFVLGIHDLLPFALSFAAGAMLYVVVEELIPEFQGEAHSHLGTFGVVLGFIVMMVLDTSFG
jgi:ZIP family zinc transporter